MIKVINNLVRAWTRLEKIDCVSDEFREHFDSLITEAFEEFKK